MQSWRRHAGLARHEHRPGGRAAAGRITPNFKDADITQITTMTLDNQEAQIKVADEVPFITGSFTNTGTASDSATADRATGGWAAVGD